MDEIVKFLSLYFDPYFTDILWVTGALAFLTLWLLVRTYLVLSKVQDQRELDVTLLQSMAKIWRKAKFAPEGARDREAKNLYKEFMQSVREEGGTCPVVVRRGKPRVMKKEEYDRLVRVYEKWTINPLLLLLSLAYSFMLFLAHGQNFNDTMFIISLMLPAMQILVAFVIRSFQKRKNKFRTILFDKLQETAVDFFNITRPWILRKCYPAKVVTTWDLKEQRDGKKRTAKDDVPFVVIGEPKEELIKESIAVVERQQKIENEKQAQRAAEEGTEEQIQKRNDYAKKIQSKIEEINLQEHLAKLELAKAKLEETSKQVEEIAGETETKTEDVTKPLLEAPLEYSATYPISYPLEPESADTYDHTVNDVPLPEPPVVIEKQPEPEVSKQIVREALKEVVAELVPPPVAVEKQPIQPEVSKEIVKEALKEVVAEMAPPAGEKREIAFDILKKMATNKKRNTELSVDSIGDALEQEIAKRKKIS